MRRARGPAERGSASSLRACRSGHDLVVVEEDVTGRGDAERVMIERRERGKARVLAVQIERRSVTWAVKVVRLFREELALMRAQRRERIQAAGVATQEDIEVRVVGDVLRLTHGARRRGPGVV